MRETGKKCGRQERSKEKQERSKGNRRGVWGGRIKGYMNEGVKMYYSKG